MDQAFGILGKVLANIILLMEILLFIRAVLSWFPMANESKFGQITYNLTEPILIPFRKLVSASSVIRNSMIDISFIVAILVLEVIKNFIIRIF